MIGTLNNKNLSNLSLSKLIEINVEGLDEKNNLKIKDDLSFLKLKNIFYLDKLAISKIIKSNNLVEDFSVFKYYPSTLEIKIVKTDFLAKIKKNGDNFFLGSNGKLIQGKISNKKVPIIFGNFKNENFFELKKAINATNFEYTDVKKLYFFKSGRWDIETFSGLVIKLPKDHIKNSLELTIKVLKNDSQNIINIIDLRQKNQVIINER